MPPSEVEQTDEEQIRFEEYLRFVEELWEMFVPPPPPDLKQYELFTDMKL